MTGSPTRPPTPAIRARRVRFDWDDTPLHWLPGDPQTTHTINVLHLLLPAGERWFVDVYREALPLVTDDALRDQVRGFMGQEAVHSRSHQAVLDHLEAQGLPTRSYTRVMDWMFERLLGPRPFGLPLPSATARQRWLYDRLAIIAAVEHFTAVLGRWVIGADGLVAAGADPTMVDLLRWHGAEEVEHRCVAFDLYEHVCGVRSRRITSMLVTAAMLFVLWGLGTRYFMRHDPTHPGRPRFTGYRRAAKQGLLPPERDLLRAVPRYLRRDHHPSQEGDTAAALAYLATSPAALAAAGTPGEP